MPEMSSENRSPSSWLWVGKLAPPHALLEAVPRYALLETLQAQLPRLLTLVVSAPGFGKTTLLSQLRQALLDRADACPVAWLSLDEADADAGRFLVWLILALESAGLDLGGLAPLAHSQALDVRPQRTVTALLQTLAGDGRRFVVILDDYHRAAGRAIDEIMLMLLERAGQGLHFVVSGRSRPAWPLAALKVRGLVHEVDAQSLALTLEEASQILGPELGQSAVATVHSKTEGWAVAVQLARLWLARGSGSAFGLSSFSGRVAEIAEYLAEQILDNLPGDCRAFMLETSLLERFNSGLADVARGRNDSAEMLARLTPFEALLVPLDADRSWYRYHLLLADFLRPRLDAQRAGQIHRQAAGWLAGQQDWVMAVSHALKAGDTDLGVQLVRQAGGWEIVLRRGIHCAQSLLQQFDELTRRSRPELTMMQAYLQAKLGNRTLAFELLRLAQIALRGHAQLERDYGVIRLLIQAYFDQFDDDPGLAPDQENAHSHMPSNPLAQACLMCVEAVGQLASGAMARARTTASAARTQMCIVDSPLGENYCLMHEAIALSMMGQVSSARELVDEALTLADQNFGTESALKALVSCFKAQHVYWQGGWSEAQRRINEAQESIEHTDGWLDVFAAAAEVSWRAGLRQHGLEYAHAVLEHTMQLARDRHLQRLVQLVQTWRVDLLSQCGFAIQAQQEAQAAGLEAMLKLASPAGVNWRFCEASTLALCRLLLATGANASAVSRLEQGASAFAAVGANLPALRMRLLALVAKRRARDGDIAPAELHEVFAPVLHDGLSGLLLEVGPGILPVFSFFEGDLPAAIAVTLTPLRAWQAHPVRPRAQFSIKETQVLTLLASGQSNKEIARALDVSENTVKFHLKQIFRKLGVENRAAAISAALQRGILTSQP